MSLYLDASVLIPLVVEEDASALVETALRNARQELIASEYAAAEAASGVSRLVRMEQLTPAAAAEALADLDAWRLGSTAAVDIEASDVRLAHIYVRRFETKLRAGDAMHLAVCRRLGATLMTLDQGLKVAADMLGVACADP